MGGFSFLIEICKITTQITYTYYNKLFNEVKMAINILKDKQIQESKPREKVYFLNDGGGIKISSKT